jgi:hypothetical protein
METRPEDAELICDCRVPMPIVDCFFGSEQLAIGKWHLAMRENYGNENWDTDAQS